MSRHLLIEAGVLGLVAVGDESGKLIDDEVVGTTMASMYNLVDVLELVVDALNNRPFAQQELFRQGHEHIAHVLAQFGDELEALGEQELLSKRRRDVACVAEEAAHQARRGLTIIDIAEGEAEIEQVAALLTTT